MKIQRLLSITTYLLNREVVSASELALKYGVSVRTIQRDIETLSAAGIPVSASQGSKGGYGIVDGYKLERQMLDSNDLFMMLTSLESIKSTYKQENLNETIEKIRSLTGNYQKEKLESLKERLNIDFSSLSVDRVGEDNFYQIERAVNEQKLISFTYGNLKGDYCEREVEPLTVVFKWYSWYLYGYCLKREDYRLFKISRIYNLKVAKKRFERREQTFEMFQAKQGNSEFNEEERETIILKFQAEVKMVVKEYFKQYKITENLDGTLTVEYKTPLSDWVIGMILSFGPTVEVISPNKVRELVKKALNETIKIYQ